MRMAALTEASTSSARNANAALRTLASISAPKREPRWCCRSLTSVTIPLRAGRSPSLRLPPSALRAHDFYRDGPDRWAIPEHRSGPYPIVKTTRELALAIKEQQAHVRER